MLRRAALLGTAALALSCAVSVDQGAAPAAPPEPAADSSELPLDLAARADAQARRTPPPARIPTTCAAPGADLCVPPRAFTERLCATSHPEAAFTLFGAHSPFTRAYLRRKMEAWYASGGRARPRQLGYAEDVLIVADRTASPSGMRVSGAGSYDVFRWDGTCVSLMSDEVTLHRPANPSVAPIAWRRLDEGVRDVLVKDRKIHYRNDRRLQDCKGDKSSARCQRARLGLSRMIANYVRQGGELPAPTEIE